MLDQVVLWRKPLIIFFLNRRKISIVPTENSLRPLNYFINDVLNSQTNFINKHHILENTSQSCTLTIKNPLDNPPKISLKIYLSPNKITSRYHLPPISQHNVDIHTFYVSCPSFVMQLDQFLFQTDYKICYRETSTSESLFFYQSRSVPRMNLVSLLCWLWLILSDIFKCDVYKGWNQPYFVT